MIDARERNRELNQVTNAALVDDLNPLQVLLLFRRIPDVCI